VFMVVNYEDSLCHVAQLAHQDALLSYPIH
jgi:hypothetical protein